MNKMCELTRNPDVLKL